VKEMLILWIILFSFLSSIGVIILIAAFLFIQEKIQKVLVPCLISYATGTLLTASLLGLIPEALESGLSLKLILLTVLIGIILFFILEKIVILRHCHELECDRHKTAGYMVIIGDAFHNAIDGVVIAASFLSSIPLGIAAGISVIMHEIPQEVGDFGVLLYSGYSKWKALLWNIISSLTTLIAAITAYYALGIISAVTPYVMAISAASFLYIALTDLYPELHHRGGFRNSICQFIIMLIGVGTILLLLQFHL
jgi:zinc and cadmium transporter